MAAELRKVSFLYTGANYRPSLGSVEFPLQDSPLRLLVVCHGFKSFKDWGFFPRLSTYFAQRGFYVVTFNFSHNGCDVQGREEADLLAFEKNCFAFEESDLREILRLAENSALPEGERVNPKNIHLLGHSRGGSAIARAGDSNGVQSLVFLASISHYSMISPEEALAWRTEGRIWVENQRTKTKLPLGLDLLEEMVNFGNILETRLRELHKPACIIHGTEDLTVPVQAAKDLSSWCEQSECHFVEGSGHTFEMKHPSEENSPAFMKVLSLVDAFLSQRQA